MHVFISHLLAQNAFPCRSSSFLSDSVNLSGFSLRARFELLCTPIFNKCIQPIRPLLEKVGLTTTDINKVWNGKRNIGITYCKMTNSLLLTKQLHSGYRKCNCVALLAKSLVSKTWQQNCDTEYAHVQPWKKMYHHKCLAHFISI